MLGLQLLKLKQVSAVHVLATYSSSLKFLATSASAERKERMYGAVTFKMGCAQDVARASCHISGDTKREEGEGRVEALRG